MARINIVDKWWTDPRRKKLATLLGSEELADGTALHLWRVAQEYWRDGRELIPISIWDCFVNREALLACNLAGVEAEGVYVCGSKEHHEWLIEKKESASAGGKKSAATRLKKYGSSQPKPRSKPEHSSNTRRTLPNTVERSSSSSSSSSKELRTEASLLALVPQAAQEIKTNEVVAAWCEEYFRKYKTQYVITGKDAGLLKTLRKARSEDFIRTLFSAYLHMQSPLYEAQKHPLSLFFRDMAAINNAAQTGIDPSRKKTAAEKWAEEFPEARDDSR